jgi:hypothetical protein
VNSEVMLVLLGKVHDPVVKNCCNLLVLFSELFAQDFVLQVGVFDELEGFENVVTVSALLLDCKHKLFFDKSALNTMGNVFWHESEEVDLGTDVNSPRFSFFDVNAEA